METGEEELQALLALAKSLVDKTGSYDSTEELMHLMQVKERNKKLCTICEETKEATSKSKDGLEGAYTALQNLLYEKNHFENEIASCRGFQSKVKEEAVALMPEEEFLASPPGQDFLREHTERSKQQAENGGPPPVPGLSVEQTQQNNYKHELMKARLVHEGLQRKQLLKQLEQVKQMKASLKESVGSQEQVLHDLQGSLKSLEKAAEPLNKVLAPATSFRGKLSKAADMLPTPLYIIYSQLVAAREALHINCNTSIAGNVDEAQHYAAAAATEAQEPQANEDPYKPHPLSIEMELIRETSTSVNSASPNPTNTVLRPLVRVVFGYLPALRVVTAQAAPPADNNLLKAMFPDDDGSSMPIEAAAHLHGPSFKYSASKVPRPYRWCQHLAGLDFVPTLPTLAAHLQEPEQGQVLSGLEVYRRQQRVLTVLQRLWDLKQGDNKLSAILGNLLKNQLPSDMSMYPKPPTSLVIAREEMKEASAAGPPLTPVMQQPQQRKRSPVRASPAAQQNSAGILQQAGQEDVQMGEQAEIGEVTDCEGGLLGSPYEDEVMVDEEGAVLESGETGDANGNVEQLEAGRSPPPGGRWKRSRDQPNAAAMLLLREGEEEEMRQAEAAAATPRSKPPSRLFRVVLRSQALEAEVHLRVFTDYLLRPPLILVKALRELPAAAAAAMDALMHKTGSNSTVKAAVNAPAGNLLEGAGASSIAWVEQQANLEALQSVPRELVSETLLYQITHLKLCLDSLTATHTADAQASAGAGTTGFERRQQLRGRDRHPAPPVQMF